MANKIDYIEIGKVVYAEGYVFVCSRCNKQYDFAILYNDYPNKPSCKICNSDMELDKPFMRITIPHPKKGGW